MVWNTNNLPSFLRFDFIVFRSTPYHLLLLFVALFLFLRSLHFFRDWLAAVIMKGHSESAYFAKLDLQTE